MIIFILLLSVIGFAFTFVLAKKSWQTGVGVVCGGIFILSLLLVTANFVSHFGMKKVVETQSIELVSSADGLDVLLYQPLGDGSEKVYLYQTPDTKEPKPTDTDYVTNTVTEGTPPELVTEKSYWEYENDFYKLFFGIVNNNHEFIEAENTFNIPETWEVLSVDQMKEFGELAKERQASFKEAAQKEIQAKMMEAIQKNPSLATDKEKQQTMIDQWTVELQNQMMQDLLNEVK
jgi:hypothetical protein